MSRPTSLANDPALAGLTSLTGLSRQPLTPEQQMQALKRVQGQAEQRIKLGMQLFKAAEARLSNHSDVLQQIKVLQDRLREQVNDDVAKSLHSYDQWIGQIDESFTHAIRQLEEKVDAVQANITRSESRIEEMLNRAETMLDQSRYLMEQQSLKHPKPKPKSQAQPPEIISPAFPVKAVQVKTPAVEKSATAESQPAAEQDKQPPPVPDQKTEQKPAPEPASPDPHEKIYSTLLKKLIEDESQNDPPADNADAA
jgi:DNA repair exonuclease SbcCD ATPase subunit